ncbi:PilZ domain-containing protein [Sphingomonas oligophenolica]|nr:PilZ domain-containing protein [Sphingomonas oligophenolica]
MNAPVDIARSPRTSVMLRASIFRNGDSDASDHRVVNVSETGLCVAQVLNLAVNTIVVVTIGLVEHAPADVVWVEAGLAGLSFHAPIDLAAARRRNARSGTPAAPASGWMAELSSPYRHD